MPPPRYGRLSRFDPAFRLRRIPIGAPRSCQRRAPALAADCQRQPPPI